MAAVRNVRVHGEVVSRFWIKSMRGALFVFPTRRELRKAVSIGLSLH